jgi:hypothetical protein
VYENSVAPAMIARLGAAVPADLVEQLTPYLTTELLRGLADLAVDLDLRSATPGGGRQHAVTFADI